MSTQFRITQHFRVVHLGRMCVVHSRANIDNIGDFSRWKDRDSYQGAFDRLLRDLKAGH